MTTPDEDGNAPSTAVILTEIPVERHHNEYTNTIMDSTLMNNEWLDLMERPKGNQIFPSLPELNAKAVPDMFSAEDETVVPILKSIGDTPKTSPVVLTERL